MASQSAFPLEIYEHILEFVAEDDVSVWKRTLANTSLVCHGWHARSRALLFRVLRFLASGEEALLRYQHHLAVAPHLAAYVEEVRIVHRPELGRILETFPRWLGIYLPRLSAIFVMVESPVYLDMHRFFCLPGARVQSVRTLEYDYMCLRDTSELEGLLLPYPNARILTLHLVQWAILTDKLVRRGLPRPLKVPLALTELRIMLSGTGQRCIHIVNRLGYEYLLQACTDTLSKLLLNIIPIRILVLQFQEDHPLKVIALPHLSVLHLEIFMVPGCATIFEDKDGGPTVPYAEVVSLIPRLLVRLHAVRLCILKLSFAAPDIDQAPGAFLEYLSAIRDSMEELILGSYFPNLKTITFDLGSRTRDILLWQYRITKCFPRLEKVISVRVLPHDNTSEDIRSDGRVEFYS